MRRVADAGSSVSMREKNLAPEVGSSRVGPLDTPSPGCQDRVASNEIAPAFLVEILPAGSS
jgi:hypothetical protein